MVSCGVAAVVCAVLVAVVVLVVIPAATTAATTSVSPDPEDADRRVREAPRRVAAKTGAATMRVSVSICLRSVIPASVVHVRLNYF